MNISDTLPKTTRHYSGNHTFSQANTFFFSLSTIVNQTQRKNHKNMNSKNTTTIFSWTITTNQQNNTHNPSNTQIRTGFAPHTQKPNRFCIKTSSPNHTKTEPNRTKKGKVQTKGKRSRPEPFSEGKAVFVGLKVVFHAYLGVSSLNLEFCEVLISNIPQVQT